MQLGEIPAHCHAGYGEVLDEIGDAVVWYSSRLHECCSQTAVPSVRLTLGSLEGDRGPNSVGAVLREKSTSVQSRGESEWWPERPVVGWARLGSTGRGRE